MNARDLFGVGIKFEENIFKSINQISATVTTRTWVLSTECTKNVTKYWYSSEKMVVFPPFCYLVDFVLQDAWILHRIKKDESDESLPVQLFEDMLSTQFF